MAESSGAKISVASRSPSSPRRTRTFTKTFVGDGDAPDGSAAAPLSVQVPPASPETDDTDRGDGDTPPLISTNGTDGTRHAAAAAATPATRKLPASLFALETSTPIANSGEGAANPTPAAGSGTSTGSRRFSVTRHPRSRANSENAAEAEAEIATEQEDADALLPEGVGGGGGGGSGSGSAPARFGLPLSPVGLSDTPDLGPAAAGPAPACTDTPAHPEPSGESPVMTRQISSAAGSRFSMVKVPGSPPTSLAPSDAEASETLSRFSIAPVPISPPPEGLEHDGADYNDPHVRFKPSPPKKNRRARSISESFDMGTPDRQRQGAAGYNIAISIESPPPSGPGRSFYSPSLPVAPGVGFPTTPRVDPNMSLVAENAILYKRILGARKDTSYISSPHARKAERKRTATFKRRNSSSGLAATEGQLGGHSQSAGGPRSPHISPLTSPGFHYGHAGSAPPSPVRARSADLLDPGDLDPHYGQTLSSIGSSMVGSSHGGGSGSRKGDDGFFQPNIHYVLFAIALLSSSADWLLDVLVEEIQAGRAELHSPDTVANYDGRFGLWVGYTVGVAILAMVTTHYVSPLVDTEAKYNSFRSFLKTPRKSAATGGIPELKTILSGSKIPKWLHFRMWVAKFIGMVLSLASGLFVGKEGPFVHMACILGDQVFKVLRNVMGSKVELRGVRQEIMIASAALGVAAAFRAPIGGVLFSVEVTAATYKVSNYSKGFFTAVLGAALVYAFMHNPEQYRWSLANPGGIRHYEKEELVVFALMGVLSGGLGGLFIAFFTVLQGWKADLNQRIWRKRIKVNTQWKKFKVGTVLGVLVAALTGVLTFVQGDYMMLGMRKSVSDLYSEHMRATDTFTPFASNWGEDHALGVDCVLYSLTIFVLCCFAITLPIVAGVFTPTMAIGAGLGRAVGELMHYWFPALKVARSGYAMVGSAAFSASVTHTISTAIVLLEMTGTMDFALPILIGVVLGVITSSYIGSSLYERICKLNDLPHIYLVRSDISGKVAYDVMIEENEETKIPTISNPATVEEVMLLLKNWEWPHDTVIAVLARKLHGPDAELPPPPVPYDEPSSAFERGCLHGELTLASLLEFIERDVTAVRLAPADDASTLSRHSINSFTGANMNTTFFGGGQKILGAIMSNPNKKEREQLSKIGEQLVQLREDFPEVLSLNVHFEREGLLKTCPRLTVETSLQEVVDYMVMLGTQHLMITDFNGSLKGKVTVRSLNKKLQAWSKAEREQRREASRAVKVIKGVRARLHSASEGSGASGAAKGSPASKGDATARLAAVFDKPTPPLIEVDETSLVSAKSDPNASPAMRNRFQIRKRGNGNSQLAYGVGSPLVALRATPSPPLHSAPALSVNSATEHVAALDGKDESLV